MKVKVTGVMVKHLKKAMPNYRISLEKMTIDQYRFSVDLDIWDHENDFDFVNNLMKVIRVEYPADYYAMPRYITTKDLNKAFYSCDKTYDGFIKAITDMCDI